MKTFKSLHELHAEKKKLARRRVELEKNLGYDLEAVKESINPLSLFSKENIRNRAGRLVMKLFGKIFRS